MIQFRRGTTKSWLETKIKLASGQPGYDKEKHKIKIGDGKSLWSELPYASGLTANEIIDSEANAKARVAIDSSDKPIFTYGTETPDENTVGQVYLQQATNGTVQTTYLVDLKADYVVSTGTDGMWTYQKWNSGIARCSCNIILTTAINNDIGAPIFKSENDSTNTVYPFSFVETPSEVVTLHSANGPTWLANSAKNTASSMGKYTILSTEARPEADYCISVHVEGRWK
jgi:hypothetical protein